MPSILRIQDITTNRFGASPFNWTVTEIPADRYLLIVARTDGTEFTFSHSGSGSYTVGPVLEGDTASSNAMRTYLSPQLGSAITQITATHIESDPFVGGILVVEMDGPVTGGTATANSDEFASSYSVSRDSTSTGDVFIAGLHSGNADAVTNTSGSGDWYPGTASDRQIFVNSGMGAAGTKTASCTVTPDRLRRINAAMFHDDSAGGPTHPFTSVSIGI